MKENQMDRYRGLWFFSVAIFSFVHFFGVVNFKRHDKLKERMS